MSVTCTIILNRQFGNQNQISQTFKDWSFFFFTDSQNGENGRSISITFPQGSQILRVVKMVDLLPSSTSLILRVVKTVDHFPPVATYSQGGENGNPSLSPTGQIFRGGENG